MDRYPINYVDKKIQIKQKRLVRVDLIHIPLFLKFIKCLQYWDIVDFLLYYHLY